MPDRAYFKMEAEMQKKYMKTWMIGSGVLLIACLIVGVTDTFFGPQLLSTWKPHQHRQLVAACEFGCLLGVIVLVFSIIGWKNISDPDAQYENHLKTEYQSAAHQELLDANMRRERRRLSCWLGLGHWFK